MSIDEKIKELFTYRRIPWLIEKAGLEKTDIYDKLMSLQKVIFEYDKYLEENWELDQVIIDQKWGAIVSEMRLWGLDDAEIERELEQIAVYARNEQSTRTGTILMDIPIRYFYYYKSCDVRLMRRLILYRTGERIHNIHQWMGFDWITEVNDDLTDVEEDRGTYNGNRFLSAIDTRGIGHAKDEYRRFIDDLEEWVNLTQMESAQVRQIVSWSREEIEETRNLLEGINI